MNGIWSDCRPKTVYIRRPTITVRIHIILYIFNLHITAVAMSRFSPSFAQFSRRTHTHTHNNFERVNGWMNELAGECVRQWIETDKKMCVLRPIYNLIFALLLRLSVYRNFCEATVIKSTPMRPTHTHTHRPVNDRARTTNGLRELFESQMRSEKSF